MVEQTSSGPPTIDDASAVSTRATDTATESQFLAEVVPQEIAYIRVRRQDGGTDLSARPTVANRLVGLAFSGGGIRSATFNLGVLQTLHRRGIFKHVDLLSTVSGGGFIGSSLTSLLSRRPGFPFEDGTSQDTAAVLHLRNNSNYLAPRGLLDYLRMFAVMIRGIILNFVVLVPFLLVPSLVATVVYGPRLLSRKQYDETAARALGHLEAAVLAENGSLTIQAGAAVAPFLDLLTRRGFVPLEVAANATDREAARRRRDAWVTDALLERNTSYPDVTEPLITGTGSSSAPYVFRPGITLSDVVHRLLDAGRLEHPNKVEEIQAVELALQRGGLRLGRDATTAEVAQLFGNLTDPVLNYLPTPGNTETHLFMVFVTEDTLIEALSERGILTKSTVPADSTEGAGLDALSGYVFSSDSDGNGATRRYSLTQILQALYDEHMFDRRWLEQRSRSSVNGGPMYRWHGDDATHLELEAAAFELWMAFGDSASSFSVEDLFEKVRQPPPLLKAFPEVEDQRRLLAALQSAGVVKRPKDAATCGKTRVDDPTAVDTSGCSFANNRSRMRLPAVLYEQRGYDDGWYERWYIDQITRQTKQREILGYRVPVLRVPEWFAATSELHYVRTQASRDREIEAARRMLDLRPSQSVEAFIKTLESLGLERSTRGTALIAPTADRGRVLSDLQDAFLVQDDPLCAADRLAGCVFVDAASIGEIPGLLYDRELYNRVWFEEYFKSESGPEVAYQKAQADVFGLVKDKVGKAAKRPQAHHLFEVLEESGLLAKPIEQAYDLLLKSKSYLDTNTCPSQASGDLTECRFKAGATLDDALQRLYERQFFAVPRTDAGPRADASGFNVWYARNVRPLVERLLWNPHRLQLPLTVAAALAGLIWVLLFPLATLIIPAFVQGGIGNRDRFERSFSLFILGIAAVAFFELQPYAIYHWHYVNLSVSWSVTIAAASVISTLAAGPAFSYLEHAWKAIAVLVVSILGPLLPYLIYLTVMGQVIYADGSPTRSGYDLNWGYVLLFFGVAALLVHVFVLALDPNSTGLHNFYKDRLCRAYLVGTSPGGDLIPSRDLKLSTMGPADSQAPYHLVNVALNLQGSDDPAVRDRRSDAFVFSKLFVGGSRTGYCRTTDLEKVFPAIDLGTAMAVSGAAAAPNMGAFTVGPLVILLALLNIRLGYWLPNPRTVRTWVARRRSSWHRFPARLLGWYSVRPGPYLFLREVLSRVDDQGTSVNISDGGHFENTAIFELLRRRCKIIIAGDAEADPEMKFAGLATLQRYARIDLGIEIDINTRRLQPRDRESSHEGRTSDRHMAVGTIHYPRAGAVPEETGYLLYLKSSLTGDEDQVILEYSGRESTFPHESTADQFFDEGQFEAYRDLGDHIADHIFEELHADEPAEKAVLDWLRSCQPDPAPPDQRAEAHA